MGFVVILIIIFFVVIEIVFFIVIVVFRNMDDFKGMLKELIWIYVLVDKLMFFV